LAEGRRGLWSQPVGTVFGVFRVTKVLLQPTARQRQALTALLAVQCEVYNAALEERRGAWRCERRAVSRFEQFGQVKDLHESRPDVTRFGVAVLRGTLTRVDLAFAAFFRRCRAGETPGYPRFRSVRRFDSVSWLDRSGWRLGDRRYLQGVGHLAFRTSRRGVRGTPKSLTVIREGHRWFAAIACHVPQPVPLPASGVAVGVDLGIAHLATLSDGTQVANPHHLQAGEAKLGCEQAALAAKVKGSGRRRAQVQRVAAAHRKTRRQRADAAHKLSRWLVERFDLIAYEDLKIVNMVRRAKPIPDPANPGCYLPNGAAAKSGLNRHIHDAGWGQLVAFVVYKAEEAGRETIAVNPRHTSQRCAYCGHVAAGNRVTQAEFRCLACGHSAHADVNAAVNILRAGLAQRPDKREVGIDA
jgi:putative transposase